MVSAKNSKMAHQTASGFVARGGEGVIDCTPTAGGGGAGQAGRVDGYVYPTRVAGIDPSEKRHNACLLQGVWGECCFVERMNKGADA